MTVNEYIEAVKQAHIDCGMPIPDAHAMAMVVDAWHKATRAERERLLPVLKLAREWLDDVCNKDTELATEEGMQVAEKIDAAIKETPAE